MKCASDETTTSLGWTLNLVAVRLSAGSNEKAIRNVDITLTVMVHS